MQKIINFFTLLALLTFTVYSQWTQLTSPTSSTLYSVNFLNSSTGFLNGALSGTVIKTINGGTSWSFISSGTSSTFYDAAFYDNSIGVAVGSNGTIIKTTNAGANWVSTLSGSSTFNSISIAQPTIGYAVGGTPSSFYKTLDQGSNWSSITPPSNNPIRCTQFFNGVYGYICGYNGVIMKTTDGGLTWAIQNQSSSYNFEKIIFLNLTTGYVIGSGGTIMKTTDGGSNWILQSSGVTTNLYGMTFMTLTNGWVVGAFGKILETTDGGSNWYPQASPSSSATYYSIKMVDMQTGYIGGSGGILLKTTNGGGPPMIPCFTKITNDPISNILNYGEGCAWGDYDNDGYQDLVVTNYNDYCTSCIYPIYLFHNNGNGTFTRITTGPIANTTTRSFGCTWGDYDNDGRLDLFVCVGFHQNNLLFHNEGNGNFTQVTSGIVVSDAGWSNACAWIDYNRDGWLDLLVINQNNYPNFLYRNNGNGTFTKITDQAICNTPNWARGCAVGDYNNDGWPDVYVNTYQGQTDAIYKNDNGVFEASGVALDANWGSGAIFGDYDNDGWLDIFVTNHNSNNILYHNNGNSSFTRINTGPGSESGPLSFGCLWTDYNNDGFVDLYVSNDGGYGFLYKNLGNGNFTKVTNEIISSDYMYGIGNSFTDVNMDGKIDLFSDNNGQGSSHDNIFYLNSCQNVGNYIGIKLKGCMPQAGYSNRDGIGARIYVYAGGIRYMREVTGGSGYHSESMLWQHVGVGNVTNIDSIVVKWPSGLNQKQTNVTVNQYILMDECLVGIQTNTNEIPTKYYLSQNYPNPFNPTTRIKYQLPKNTFVNLEVYDYLGKKVSTLINAEQTAGYYEADFNGENCSSGVYFYKIQAGDFTETHKMILMK